MIKKLLNRYLMFKSFSTNRKVLLIESDDWGSIRTKGVFEREKLKRINPKCARNPYIEYDSIASQDDLESLFNVLLNFKDAKGNHAKLTANTCVANPEFNLIKESNFKDFVFEPFWETLNKYSRDKNLFSTWKEGIDSGVFCPQLHGREHLHSEMWLSELRSNNSELLKAFELDAWGIPYSANIFQRRANLQAALDIYNLEGEENTQIKWLNDSVKLFNEAFGYSSKTFIPPAYTWHSRILKELHRLNIEAVQGIKLQYEPSFNQRKKYKRILRYTGEQQEGISFIIRNVFFEPSLEPDKDVVDSALMGINHAFKNNKVAIIGSHRLNFIGALTESNRDKNLKKLEGLLNEVTKRWPDVEFMSSDQLIDYMNEDNRF